MVTAIVARRAEMHTGPRLRHSAVPARIYNLREIPFPEFWMKSSAIALFLGAFLCGAATAQPAPAVPEAAPPETPAFFKEPSWLGQDYFNKDSFAKLDALVADYVKSGTRTDDGRFALYMLTSSLEEWFGLWTAEQDGSTAQKLDAWNKENPGSAMQPIVAAMQMHRTAWRVRGGGYSSTVTEEGWRLFRERDRRAWQILMDHKKESSVIPTWYELAISIGGEIDISDDELRKLFDEGIRRHPGYHPIYFTFARQFTPRWGGNYADADAFILEQTKAKTNPEGEILYARLYWLMDQYEDGSPSFFEDSLVSWRRMRSGFERMMLAYPKSAWNQANFAVYACRARDATTYALLRPKINAGQFQAAAPEGISLEVCDARFMKTT
jgi:hypothetical protein